MKGHQKICILFCVASLVEFASSSERESRTSLHIPEKIIGGVIDIVQSHKNKPIQGTQQTYPTVPQYNYQNPQYQQWNSQSNFQNQGFQTQPQNPGQYQNQGQYSYQNGYNQAGNFPQGGGNYNPSYPVGTTVGQTFTQGQNQQVPQGQYSGVYQNANQYGQPNNQFQTTQSGYYTGQGQSSNQYQGSSGSFQGQTGHTQGQGIGNNGQFSQGFMTTGGQSGNGQGPSCVCQAWTKPQPTQEIYADTPATEKIEKKQETP